MLERVSFFVKHSFAHIFFYVIPRMFSAIWTLPRRLVSWLFRRSPQVPLERKTLVVTNEKKIGGAKEAFGLPDELIYKGPLYNGHLHTILSGLRVPMPANYTREVVESHGGQRLNMDYMYPDCPADEIHGMLLIIPGLLNASTTNYVRHMATIATRARFGVCVLNYRGMGSTPLEQPRLFSATFTDDIRHCVAHYLTPDKVQQRLGTATHVPVVAVGFSLGGITLIKYIAEEGQRGDGAGASPHTSSNKKAAASPSPVAAAIAVTSPFDLVAGDVQTRTWQYSHLYEKPFAAGLRKYVKHNQKVLERLPNVSADMFHGDSPRINTIRSIHQFDEFINASHNGFDTVQDYYCAANSLPLLEHTRTPVMCIANSHDPVTGPPIPIGEWNRVIDGNHLVCYVCTPCGGHLGYLGSPLAEWRSEANECEKLVIESCLNFCAFIKKNV